jgi:hypothetical protein
LPKVAKNNKAVAAAIAAAAVLLHSFGIVGCGISARVLLSTHATALLSNAERVSLLLLVCGFVRVYHCDALFRHRRQWH